MSTHRLHIHVDDATLSAIDAICAAGPAQAPRSAVIRKALGIGLAALEASTPAGLVREASARRDLAGLGARAAGALVVPGKGEP